jgi:hypothetical protein
MYMAACFMNNKLDNLDEFIEDMLESSEREQKRSVKRVSKKAPSMDKLLGTLMGNKDIVNMATELTKDLQESNLDPMTLMGSLMGGTPNAELNKLVNSITTKLEKKISSGEINKDELEKQARDMMSVIGESDLSSMFGNTLKM